MAMLSTYIFFFNFKNSDKNYMLYSMAYFDEEHGI